MSLWQPRSGCDLGCLPEPGSIATVHIGRRLVRLVAAAGVLAAGALAVPLIPTGRRAAFAQRWAGAMLRALGVGTVERGRLPRPAALLVANHVSWLDILVLLGYRPIRLVAKREVRDWPGIGRLAAATGTIFIDRSRPKSLPATVAEVAAALRAGAVVAAFPEGTTWCGRRSGPFRPALFQAALDAGTAVVPVSLCFRIGGATTTAAAFLGEDTLWTSLQRILAVRGLTIGLTAAPAVYPEPPAGRRDLARIAAAAIAPTAE